MGNANWKDFVHLHVRTPYSFYEGAGRINELVETASRLGQKTIAFTDRNRTSGLVRGYKAAYEAGLKPVLGMLLDDPRDARRYCLLWATDFEGYGQLGRLASERQLNPEFTLDLIAEEINDSVIVATSDEDILLSLRNRLSSGNLYGNLTLPDNDDRKRKARGVYEICRKNNIPMVVTGDVAYATKEQEHTSNLLRAIGEKQVLLRTSKGRDDIISRPLDDNGELLKAYRNLPEVILNSRLIAERCNVDLRLGELKFPEPILADNRTSFEELKERTEHGLLQRYGNPPPLKALERLAYELGVIDHLGYTGYMVVVHDIAREAWNRGVKTLGRGSAANSIVCFCLRLTDICPLKYDLYFERFLNPERKSPPDIDLDFSWRDRDETLRNIFETYGNDHVGLICTTVTFGLRAALHEAASARGIPEEEITRFTKRIPWFSHGKTLMEVFAESPECAGLPLDREPWAGIARDADQLNGLPRHLSIHAGGVVISPDPITDWTGLEMAAKGFVVTQYDMYSTEDLGLVKIDLLSQRALGVLKDASLNVKDNTGVMPPVENVEMLFRDKKTWETIRTGNSMGCFYIESPGMRVLLKKLDCDHFELLVAASSVIRPGVSESGMMKQYVDCVRDPSKAVFLHPKMQNLLGETYGVMIYQEDVIKICHYLAGISLGRSDTLRRAMSGKGRSPEALAKLEREFLDGCRINGVQEDIATEIWRQVYSFAGYAFCKAHSASFAVLSVQIAYLRTYFPAEFMAGVLANCGGFYSQAAYVEEAKRMGLKVLLPHINSSHIECRGEGDKVYIGLKAIGTLREETPQRIVEDREQNGQYKNLGDFMRRVKTSRDETEAMISCGAFDRLAANRPTLLRMLKAGWSALQRSSSPLALDAEDIFSNMPDAPDWSEMEKLIAERRILGYSPGKHPLALLDLPMNGAVPARDLERHLGRKVTMIGWSYASKKITTRTKKEKMIFLSMEDLTGTFEVTLFPRVFRRFATIVRGHGPFRVTGQIEDDQGVSTLVGENIEKIMPKGCEGIENTRISIK
ncbi:MAG: DNA polymerase III subunit alpha [Candidatus Electryonea clarkiae]|nr:DNA polymerase III subunit alpha [Candidatus Electryonea clarkiae]MDP8289209.1 DNA polymerase III subunit alpha [Candidatus Electryonea clarkiae]